MPIVLPSDKQAFARIALIGPSGSGKSWTALELAIGLADGKRIAVIDTERSSMNKYYGERSNEGEEFRFYPYAPPLEDFSPENYTKAIEEISTLPDIGVLIIDSLSHAWTGKGGALEKVNNATKRSQSGNSYAAWRDVTPLHNRLIDTILSAPFHIIATMRTKTEYVMEKDERTGKTTIRKVGLAPVQREGMEYEFDIVGDINQEHELIVTKTRMRSLKDAVVRDPSSELGRQILDWCHRPTHEIEGLSFVRKGVADNKRSDEEMKQLIAAAKASGVVSADAMMTMCIDRFNKTPRELTSDEYKEFMKGFVIK